MIANFASGPPLNTIGYISKEAFLTHTTHLNSYWNDKVVNGLKTTPYKGDDPLYENETAYTYIENHLGYRFVLKDSYLNDRVTKKDLLKLKSEIQNVGFSNFINEKKTSIILKGEDAIYEVKIALDATMWDSKKITEERFQISLPDAMKEGAYKVYLRISEYGNLIDDSNHDIYDEDLETNYIGQVSIENVEITSIPTLILTPPTILKGPNKNQNSESLKIYINQHY